MNSRQKGKRGEREAAQVLNSTFGLRSRRGVQFSGGPDSPDVVGVWPNTHCEVKRVEKVDLDAAMEQAVRDADGKLPFVMHRKNKKPWMITVRVEDFARFVRAVKGEENG